jgi:hypothetical protein
MSQIENIAAELSLWANESQLLYSRTNELVYNNLSGHLNLLSAYTYRLLAEPTSGGVTTFNTRVGNVVLLSTDITSALGYTPPVALNELNDVTIPSPSDGQLLRFNSATGQWENWSPSFNAFKIDYDYNISGIKNGVNTNFNTSSNFVAGSTRVFLNGQRLTRGGGYDYLEAGVSQVSLVYAPVPSDQLIIEYQII